MARWLAALGPPPPRRRDVVNLHRPLAEAESRDLVGWALASGAAVVLVPPELDWIDATVWARPTVLAATAAELVALETALASRPLASLRSWRGPLRRLRAVVALDRGAEAFEPTSLWRRLGVAPFGARMIPR